MHETFREIHQEISVRRIDLNTRPRQTFTLFEQDEDALYCINSFARATDYWLHLSQLSSSTLLRIESQTQQCADLRGAHDLIEERHGELCELRKTHLPDNDHFILEAVELGGSMRRRIDPAHVDLLRKKTLRFIQIQKTAVTSLEESLRRKLCTVEKKQRWSRADEYMQWRRHQLPGQTDLFPDEKYPGPRLHWNRTDTDLLELATALFEAGALKSEDGRLTKKQVQHALEWLFNRPVSGASVKLAKARNRKVLAAPFMEDMKRAFEQYVVRKDMI